MSERQFRNWCENRADREVEEKVWGEDNPYIEPDRYRDQLVCDRVIYNVESGEVSGNLEAIHFEGGDPSFSGDKIKLRDATWNDMDGDNHGEGSLTVEVKDRGGITLYGWR